MNMDMTGWKLLHKEQFWLSGAHSHRASNRPKLTLKRIYEYDGYIIHRYSKSIIKDGKKFWRTNQWNVCGFKYPTNLKQFQDLNFFLIQ